MKSNYHINKATQAHLPQCTQLWHDCFGDDEAFIQDFFCQIPLHGWLILEDDHVVSQLFILQGKHPHVPNHPVYYIYACATAETHRKQGLMTTLLHQVAQEASEGNALVFIQPADSHLADYYGRCGFKPIYRYKTESTHTFSPSNLKIASGSLEKMLQIRNNSLNSNRIIWPSEHLELATKIAKDENGDILFFTNGFETGYILYRQGESQAISIDETVYSQGISFQEVLDFLHQQTGCKAITFKQTDSNGTVGAMAMGDISQLEIDWSLGLD